MVKVFADANYGVPTGARLFADANYGVPTGMRVFADANYGVPTLGGIPRTSAFPRPMIYGARKWSR